MSNLAYVFWHHPAAGVAAAGYEESLKGFHRALTAHAPPGFRGSASFAFTGAPWFPAGPVYLDWYNVDDFTALGLLNDAAVAGARKQPHDYVARMTGAGFGGVSRRVAGLGSLRQTKAGTWLTKPAGMAYGAFIDQVSEHLDKAGMTLWQRQMALGPGLEFCIHSGGPVEIPVSLGSVSIELRQIWS
jgi:hypothetical protein